jgi:hypothetical protein
VERENALDSDSETHLANGERCPVRRTVPGDDDALEHLGALPTAFDDADMDLDGVTGSKIGDVVAHVRALNQMKVVHGGS